MHGRIETRHLSKLLSKAFARPVNDIRVIPVGGGSINSTYQLQSSAGAFFLKVNNGLDAEAMFKAEIGGLDLLRIKSSFTIPHVKTMFSDGQATYLLMDYIKSANRSNKYWQELAIKLAELHKHTQNKFGLVNDNFIGSLPQHNAYENDWHSFFVNQRIMPMVKLAFDKKIIAKGFIADIEAVLNNITDLMPEEPPALVHGDLWSGNIMVDSQGNACLVDPAVYYGHREMDLAFSHLFGGFSQLFYHTYQEVYPMQPDFNKRIAIYNLYPLLVHLNLFGKSYLGDVEQIIARFI